MTLVNWKTSSLLSLMILGLLFSLSSCGDDDTEDPNYCETLELLIGDECDDGDIATINDVVTADCICDGKTTKVFGTITIENPEVWTMWADSGEVQVTIFPAFSLDPLAGWGAVPNDFFGPGFLGGTFAAGAPYNSQNPPILTYEEGKTEYEYEIELEAGTYSALAVGFRHDGVTDASLKTATLGVHWDNESEVSHGVVIQIQAGPSVMTIFDEPAPTSITVEEGQELEVNFTTDFDFVNQWYQ